jgi:large subunit ribosomal protein L32
MIVPKRKTSKSRRDKRRSSVWKLKSPTLSKCGHCGEFHLRHRVCANCGFYRGRAVLVKEKTKAQ